MTHARVHAVATARRGWQGAIDSPTRHPSARKCIDSFDKSTLVKVDLKRRMPGRSPAVAS